MIIYKITDKTNGKIYIGQTTKTISKRWTQHKHKGLKSGGHKNPLYAAMMAHGLDNFSIEEIDSASSIEELNRKEQEHIRTSNSQHPNGYNLASGGFSSSGTSAWNKGLKTSDKTKEKLSKAHMGQIPGNRKQVLCLNNNVVYLSLHHAAKDLNLLIPKISQVANGQRKHTQGFRFTYSLPQQPPVPAGWHKPTVYLLAGQSGVGKTWVSSQLKDRFVTLSNDMDGPEEAVKMMVADTSKTYIYETPVYVSTFINKNQHLFDIKLVVILEDEETVKARLLARSGSALSAISRRHARFKSMADRYGAVFTGTSQECLEFLKIV